MPIRTSADGSREVETWLGGSVFVCRDTCWGDGKPSLGGVFGLDTNRASSPGVENFGLDRVFYIGTELAECEPITVLQSQMRHADVRTTLKIYAHFIPQSQRQSMERIANRSIGSHTAFESALHDRASKTRINTAERSANRTNVP